MRDIHEGDTVSAYFTADGQAITGVVENKPGNPGDMWYIRTSNGTIVAINPSCANLESIQKAPTPREGGKDTDQDHKGVK